MAFTIIHSLAPRPYHWRHKVRAGLWEFDLCFRYGVGSKRIMSSSLFCKLKQSPTYCNSVPPGRNYPTITQGWEGQGLLSSGLPVLTGQVASSRSLFWASVTEGASAGQCLTVGVSRVCTTHLCGYRKESLPICVNICWSVGRAVQRMCLPLTFHPQVNS